MIYTFKVHAAADPDELLETTHCAHGADVLGLAKVLIEKYPDCGGVEVLMLGSRLFFMPPSLAPASHTQSSQAHTDQQPPA
jgi:hypothetical protein